jgi:hypothetical protein
MKKLYTLLLLVIVSVSAQSQVVISQVYGGGGNASATYTNDFVELFNKGAADVDISGYSVQYAAASASPTWAVCAIPAGTTIASGKYFLIKLAGSAVGIALPSTDLDASTGTSPINLSATKGHVALVNNSTALVGALVTTGYVDLIGYGTATSFETAAFPTTGTNNTLSFQRGNNGCTDTNNNSTDFALGSVNPRNSSTASYSCTAPSISIASPVNNTLFSPETTSVSVSINVNNFVVANGTGDGHIHYTINGGATVMKYDTTPIAIPTTPGTTYTVFMQLVNNSHAPLSPVASATLTFTVASYTTVANLAALRADVVANGANKYYQIGSAPIITYARTARNQKYVQDTTGGVLIDDLVGSITTTFAAGDSMTGLKGQAVLYNSLLEFVPSGNASVGTSGNIITPQLVTIADLNSSVTAATYESELVQINNVTFDLTVPAFATTTANMNITNGADTLVFRSLFTEANYMGTNKPTAATNIIALVGRAANVAQVVSRNLADLNAPLLTSNSFNSINGLSVYPNPVKNGVFYINTDANAERIVTVFDVLGKQVFNTKTSDNAINASSLTAGVYMVQISEEGKTATKKLVIE